MSRNDELKWLFTNRFSSTRYMKIREREMKIKRMEITKILRRIWLFSTNKVKSYESVSKQPTQLIITAHDCHNGLDLVLIRSTPHNMGSKLIRSCFLSKRFDSFIGFVCFPY